MTHFQLNLRAALRIMGWLTLALLVALGALWQQHARAYQRLDVGTPPDEGALYDFYGRERSDDGTDTTFRWSEPSAGLQLWRPAGAPQELRLRMLAPLRPGAAQRVALIVADRPLPPLDLTPGFRLYRFLAPPAAAALDVRLESPPLWMADDPRALGLVLDSVESRALVAPGPAALPQELATAPFLPLGLALLAACGALLSLRSQESGVRSQESGVRSQSATGNWRLPTALALPLAAMVALFIAGRALPEARLTLAAYVTTAGAVGAAALAGAQLLRRGALWPHDDRRAHAWIAAVFAGALLLAFVPGVQSDGTGYYAYVRSLVLDGDISFGNEYRDMPFPHGRPDAEKELIPATGYYDNPYSIGPGLTWMPLFGLGHAIALLGQPLGLPWPADGYAPPYEVLTTFSSALAGLVALLALYRICRRWVNPPAALLGVLCLWLGSNLLYYNLREGSFAHGVSTAAVALYVLAWLRLEERPSVGRWAALGLAAGAVALTYWVSALLLLPPALSFARLLLRALRGPPAGSGPALLRLLLGGALALLLLILVVSPQFIAWHLIYGSLVTVPQGAGYITPGGARWSEFLFSPLHGLLPWTPALFLGLPGVALLWRKSRWATLSLAAPMLLYFWYNTTIPDWHGSGAFGLRRMTVLAPWGALGLALIFEALARWRRAAPAALAALICAWTLLMMVRYDLYLIPRTPGELDDMPVLAFYFAHNALPIDRIGDWVRGGFFYKILLSPMPLPYRLGNLALAAVMAATTAAVWTAARASADSTDRADGASADRADRADGASADRADRADSVDRAIIHP